MKQYASSFSDLCIMVFRELGQISISPSKPFALDASTAKDWDITAVIGLAGKAKGVVELSMKKTLALQLTDKLSGGTHTAIDQDVIDVLGEITNIIAGRSKQIMENEFKFETSLPLVISHGTVTLLQTGQEHSINWPARPVRNICIPFTIFENEQFILSISVQNVAD